MVSANLIKNWKRKYWASRLEKHLKQRDKNITAVIQEGLVALKDRTDHEFISYLDYLRDGSLLLSDAGVWSEAGIRPSAILHGNISNLITLTKTPERFYEFLKKSSGLAARLSKDYKNPEQPLSVALGCIPIEVKTTSQFEDYLKQYEMYFRLVAKQGDDQSIRFTTYPDNFAHLRKDANTLEEICFATDCLEMAVNAGIYVYKKIVDPGPYEYDHVNTSLPNCCVKAARRLGSFDEYKKRFSNVTTNLSDESFPPLLSYGAPLVAIFASTRNEIQVAYSKLQEFWNKVIKVVIETGGFRVKTDYDEMGVEYGLGGSIEPLVSVVSDYQGFAKCLDSLASLWESCEKVALGYGPRKGGGFEQGQIRKAKEKIIGKHYPKIIAMSVTADQFAEYTDAYIKFYKKITQNSEYNHMRDSVHISVKSIVDKEMLDILPVVVDTIKKYGDFDVAINVGIHGEELTYEGDLGLERYIGTIIDSVQINIKDSGKIIGSVQIERPARGWAYPQYMEYLEH